MPEKEVKKVLEKTLGNLVVIVGPSGVGKGTVLRKVFKDLDKLVFSVSVTTRPIRAGEVEGINYFFKTKEEFMELVKAGELLEWAEFVGNYYGTPKKYVEEQIEQGNDVVLEIEVEGAKQIKKNKPDALFIFISPPSIEILYKRLKERSTEAEDKILSRIEKSKQELQEISWFDHQIVNEQGQVNETAEKLIQIIKAKRK
ncbi:MAG: guanylate kinase [Candidatus Caenarcaniphilales bacterium]|nr:guanylate kinase [Candidatus Caenarcaniphilales bacterium]